MGKQVNFFMSSDDEREFAEFVLCEERVVLIPQACETASLPQFRSPEEANALKQPTALLIWNKAICGRIKLEQHAPDAFAPDISNDPLVEFNRSFFHDRTLVAGRLWAEMYAFDKVSGKFVYKGNVFEQWYNKLAGRIRRHYKRESKYGIYIGPCAEEAYKQGTIALAQHLTLRGPI